MRLTILFVPLTLLMSLLTFGVSVAQSIQNSEREDKTVKIGLLIPDSTSKAARYGAELAILKANEKGGFKGKPFQLMVKSMEGPWGTGSKQAVNLIFNDNVCAIMGSPDGRNGHLVEQVTTKARIVFLSAWAGDPTLAQAFVPWYFSVVPTDLQQADALIDEIYNKRKMNKIVAVSDNDYDSKLAAGSFVKKTKQADKADPLLFYYENSTGDFNDLTKQIKKTGSEAIVLFGKPSASSRLIQQLRQNKIDVPIFGTLSLMDENELSGNDLKNYEGVTIVSAMNLSQTKSKSFREDFLRTYGKLPGMVAEYSFDGMSLLIEAVRSAGTDRENIQKTLAKLHYEGVTGPIQFDDKGKRVGAPSLVEIKNDTPVIVEK